MATLDKASERALQKKIAQAEGELRRLDALSFSELAAAGKTDETRERTGWVGSRSEVTVTGSPARMAAASAAATFA